MLQSDIKSMNKRIIFDLFRDHRQLTKVDASQLSGISLPSVIKAVDALIDAYILVPAGEKDTALGRKPLNLRFNADAISAFGVEYEGDRLSIGLVKIDGTVEYQISKQVEHLFNENLAKQIADMIQKILFEVDITKRRVAGVGIGIPGAVDPMKNIIQFAPLIGISEPIDADPVLDILRQRLNYPVYIENDVNSLALGEILARKAFGGNCPTDLIFISLGTGLGAGVILNGELRHGCRYLCGELGYYSSTEDGFSTRRDQGWLEAQLNMDALQKKFKFSSNNKKNTDQVISHIVHYLAPAITNLVTFFDIETVVLGGVLIDELGEQLAESMNERVAHLALNEVNIEKHLSSDPGIVGAATMVIDRQLDDLV